MYPENTHAVPHTNLVVEHQGREADGVVCTCPYFIVVAIRAA
jgi:hypothetical protein